MADPKPSRPVVLCILDGWGHREAAVDNAIALAHPPNFNHCWRNLPHAFLQASGRFVGLPDGQMGNSEMGHLTLGAGRVIKQELVRIGDAIENGRAGEGEIVNGPAFQGLIQKLKQAGGTCHLMGLVSPGGVHSHQDHIAGLAHFLVKAGVPVTVHAFTDGRDTPPFSAADDIMILQQALPASVSISTVCGRYFAMDRDKRWDRIKLAYDLLTQGAGEKFTDPISAIKARYAASVISDEFIKPVTIGDYQGMKDGDGILCANFRADRVREILAALADPAFNGFPREKTVKFSAAVGMTRYSDALAPFMTWLFDAEHLINMMGSVVSDAGRKQLRIAETEKFAHVTYFFNGGQETPFPGEDRILVPSPKVATYDLQPQMSAPVVTDRLVEAIESGKYDLVVANYANMDMVGHTGSLAAAITAAQIVDECLGRIIDAVEVEGGTILVTADHGNGELMKDPETGGPHTSHTTNPVPIILVNGPPGAALRDGTLPDVASTVLDLMGLQRPHQMTGRSLLIRDRAPA